MRISDWSSDVCSSDLSAIGGHPFLAEDDRRLGLVSADFFDRQPLDLVREDQPAVGWVDMKMGRQVGDVAARLVPDGRDADVARHIVTAARLQFGEEGADAAARIEDVVDQEQAVVGAERVDQIAEGEHLHLCFLAVDRSEEHTSELQSLMRISYAVFCLNKNTNINMTHTL